MARAVCGRCLRAQSACICCWITLIAHEVELLILQHPLEAGHAKGSARLLHLSLPRSRLVVGEAFAQQELFALLHGHDRHPVLLYPDTPAGVSAVMPPPQRDAPPQEPAQLRLVILDATWRKSRKMLYANPLLQALPRLALCDMPASQYRIRKAHRDDQLSTLEAACYALMRLEKSEEKYRPLLSAFDGFVEQQSAYRALRTD